VGCGARFAFLTPHAVFDTAIKAIFIVLSMHGKQSLLPLLERSGKNLVNTMWERGRRVWEGIFPQHKGSRGISVTLLLNIG